MNDSNSIDDNQTDSYPPRWFGFKGRITRSRWWAFNALYVGICLFVSAVFAFTVFVFSLLSEGIDAYGAMEKMSIILTSLLTIVLLGINAQRLHDIGNGYSGWWQLVLHVISNVLFTAADALNTEQDMILVIMLGSLAICIWIGIGCIPGNPEKNNYGNPPPRKR